ncbi:hypothetical protein Tco_0533110 [Tanacetum coccineum]
MLVAGVGKGRSAWGGVVGVGGGGLSLRGQRQVMMCEGWGEQLDVGSRERLIRLREMQSCSLGGAFTVWEKLWIVVVVLSLLIIPPLFAIHFAILKPAGVMRAKKLQKSSRGRGERRIRQRSGPRGFGKRIGSGNVYFDGSTKGSLSADAWFPHVFYTDVVTIKRNYQRREVVMNLNRFAKSREYPCFGGAYYQVMLKALGEIFEVARGTMCCLNAKNYTVDKPTATKDYRRRVIKVAPAKNYTVDKAATTKYYCHTPLRAETQSTMI